MNTKTLKAMADRLQELADGADPERKDRGICHVMQLEFGAKCRLYVAETTVFWPEYSGNKTYPVPHEYLGEIVAFENLDDLWSGEYGAARRRLCGFLASEIRKEVGDETN